LPAAALPPAPRGDEPSVSPLAAGDFSAWMVAMEQALCGQGTSDVPCGECTACCTSSQFVHIGPDETDALAHIPVELLFPAPGLPRGHVLLGYDDRGHCPMLIDGRCSIYEHRPRTCRTYDCRVFPAAGISADDDKVFIVRQSRRWDFSFPAAADRVAHEAVRAAATFLDTHREELPVASRPANATQLAVLALEVHRVFLTRDERTGHTTIAEPTVEIVAAEVTLRARAGRAKTSRAKQRRTKQGRTKPDRSKLQRSKTGRAR
jgi:Fe-S-cluster containining protein